MGNVLGMNKIMDDQLAKNQEFMLKMQTMTLERQLAMQNVMRERMMATQIARSRDLFYWFASFYSLALIGGIAGFRHTRKPAAIVPLVPLTFILGYQADMAFYTKIHRIQVEAESILKSEQDLLAMPGGVPTVETIDQARRARKDEERAKSHQLFL
ncbi:unnamed protein product [Owenia fusiformis]|uniref:Plasminogen receptor (KT) n=1 Tax=Owenia fusiformis TaxID=6347 RepID=A0A8S4N1L3_OWEFU|nr:unnamed protein product [Owenia fusiformis]